MARYFFHKGEWPWSHDRLNLHVSVKCQLPPNSKRYGFRIRHACLHKQCVTFMFVLFYLLFWMNHDKHFFICEPVEVRHRTGLKIVCFLTQNVQ